MCSHTRCYPRIALTFGIGLTMLALAGNAANEPPKSIDVKLHPAATMDVKAFWEPITSSFAQAWPELRDFRPAEEVRRYSTQDFAAVLPKREVRVGDTWQVDKAGCVKLLKQFHEGARGGSYVDNGDSPEDGLAILARYNDQSAVILARFHGGFVLKEGWLTPGQFKATLGSVSKLVKQVRRLGTA
jgi:hypothetical protein